MNTNKRKHTLKSFFVKSVFYAIFAIIITCVVVGIYSFRTIDGYIHQIMNNKLNDISAAVAGFINNEKELFELQPGQEDTETYQRCLQKLREIRDITDIKYIYIAKKDESDNTVFLIDADEEVENPIGLEYEADDEEYRELAFSGRYVITEITYESEFGELISGYAPIKDEKGNVTAILGVDYSIEELNKGISRAFRIYLLICIIISVVIISLFMLLENIEYAAMKRVLSESISVIKNVSDEVNNYSKELQKGNVTLLDNTNSSLSAINEMSATMNQTSAMIKQNNDSTQKATRHFEESNSELQKSIKKMEELNSSIASIKISSDEIRKIIEVINNIAKKTKILALNAEVEAARVGEHGKGFSSVAKEVGDLALSSEAAAKDINAIISSNISMTEKTVNDSNAVSDAITIVNKRLSDFLGIINELSMASAEQEKGLQYLTDAATLIERTTTSNAGLAGEIKNSADTLTDMTDDLNCNIDNIEEIAGAAQ